MRCLRPVVIRLCRVGAVLAALGSSVAGARAGNSPPSTNSGAAPMPPESNRRMARMLVELRDKVDPLQSSLLTGRAAQLLQAQLASATDLKAVISLRLSLAAVLVNDGRPEEALHEIEACEQRLADAGQSFPPAELPRILELKALCCLRIGEQENCVLNHNVDSCLLPIRGGGVHLDQRGSRAAIDVLQQLIALRPGPSAIWLYNVAYMTIGGYPDQVPSRWLVPPRVFDSDYDIKRFPDVAGALGLDVDDLAGGVVVEDFDRDGFLDVMVSAMGYDSPIRYFHNNGDGSFTELTDRAGLRGETGSLNLVSGDFDNDGRVDVLALRGGWQGDNGGRFPNSLLRNNGDNTFTDVTEAAGLLSFHPTQTAAWFDYNGDGWLDLFIGNESRPDRHEIHPCELYRNNGDGTFTECAADCGLAIVDFVKGVAVGDFNNDGRPDLYLSSRDGPDRLLRNDGPAAGPTARTGWRFTDVTAAAGVAGPAHSFPCWFFDYDNDGWLDIFVSGYQVRDVGDVALDYMGVPNHGEKPRLYRNNHDGTFTDVTRSMGLDRTLLTMGSNFGDLDNDGWLDFYLGTGDPYLGMIIPNRMFRNNEGRGFQDVTTSGGFGQLQKGHGVAFADLNNDGEQDVYAVTGGAVPGDHYPNQLLANPGHGHHWLKLELEGVASNRIALGARIDVVVRTGAGRREIHRVVGSGGSFGASPIRRQEIGLGAADAIERVEVTWPTTGKTQVLRGLHVDRLYAIREGDDHAREQPLRRFDWPAPTLAPHHHHS